MADLKPISTELKNQKTKHSNVKLLFNKPNFGKKPNNITHLLKLLSQFPNKSIVNSTATNVSTLEYFNNLLSKKIYKANKLSSVKNTKLIKLQIKKKQILQKVNTLSKESKLLKPKLQKI